MMCAFHYEVRQVFSRERSFKKQICSFAMQVCRYNIDTINITLAAKIGQRAGRSRTLTGRVAAGGAKTFKEH